MENNGKAKPTPIQLGLIHKPLAEYETKSIEYLPLQFPKFKFPIGKLTLLVGDPGECKSFVACDTLAYLTKKHGYQIIVLSEDDPSDTLKPRIEAMGGIPKLIEPITGTQISIDTKRGFILNTDMKLFRKLVIEKKPKVVFIDPIVSYSGGVDTFKGGVVRALLDPYVDLAKEFGFALICIIHLNKANTKALYKISDSVQFSGIARSIYFCGPNPDKKDPENKVICHLKTNVSKPTPSYTFHIESVPNADPKKESDLGKLVWGFEVEGLTAEDVCNAVEKKKGGNVTKIELAGSLIMGALRRGPQPISELLALANELDIKEATFKRARLKLNVGVHKLGTDARHWLVFLPGYEEAPTTEGHDPLAPLLIKTLERTCNVLERLDKGGKTNEPLGMSSLVGQEEQGDQTQKRSF